MLMTKDRDGVRTEDVRPGAAPVAVRTGDAANMLRPAAERLGLRMDRQEVRRLCDQGKLAWEQLTARGWRLVSIASINALIEEYTVWADRAENPQLPPRVDAE